MRKVSKRVIYFLLSYILTVFVGMLLFSGIGSSLPNEVSSVLFGNFLISIILMFWLFVGLPAVVAYFVAFRFKRGVGSNEELGLVGKEGVGGEGLSEKRSIILAASLTIVSVLVIIFVFSRLATPRFDPYSLEGIEERDIPRATPASLSPITIPDLSNEPVKEKQAVDTSSWKKFQDKLVGIQFDYPEDWGEPGVVFRRGGENGLIYSVYFPGALFVAGGTSVDFSEARDGYFTDFNGFGSQESGNYFWLDAKDLCKDKHFLFCREIGGAVHALTDSACSVLGFRSFQRILFLNRPGETISGLAFGGQFLSSSYSSLTEALCSIDDEKKRRTIETAILERRIDDVSARNLDIIERVFETIKMID